MSVWQSWDSICQQQYWQSKPFPTAPPWHPIRIAVIIVIIIAIIIVIKIATIIIVLIIAVIEIIIIAIIVIKIATIIIVIIIAVIAIIIIIVIIITAIAIYLLSNNVGDAGDTRHGQQYRVAEESYRWEGRVYEGSPHKTWWKS